MAFNSTTTFSDAYALTDLDALNWFERQWVAWYLLIENPIIATGLMSFLMHEVVYFGRCIPWIIIDATPYFRRWKLQPTKIPTAKEQWECTKLVLFSHVTVELPAIWLFHPMAETIGMQTYQVPFPAWQSMIPQVCFFFFVEDFWHWAAHRALHVGPLYKYIHKIHHKYPAPFGLAAEYAHPAEVFILGTGTLIGPLIYCFFRGDLHIVTVYIWIMLRLFQTIDAHSGYDFPWSLQHIVPFWAGAEHHDFHHMTFTSNFATSFRWWDRLFGTDKNYLRYRERLQAADKMSAAERTKLEERLMKQFEAEGLEAEESVVRGSGPRGKKFQ